MSQSNKLSLKLFSSARNSFYLSTSPACLTSLKSSSVNARIRKASSLRQQTSSCSTALLKCRKPFVAKVATRRSTTTAFASTSSRRLCRIAICSERIGPLPTTSNLAPCRLQFFAIATDYAVGWRPTYPLMWTVGRYLWEARGLTSETTICAILRIPANEQSSSNLSLTRCQ